MDDKKALELGIRVTRRAIRWLDNANETHFYEFDPRMAFAYILEVYRRRALLETAIKGYSLVKPEIVSDLSNDLKKLDRRLRRVLDDSLWANSLRRKWQKQSHADGWWLSYRLNCNVGRIARYGSVDETPEDSDKLRKHVAKCRRCRRELETSRLVRGAFEKAADVENFEDYFPSE